MDQSSLILFIIGYVIAFIIGVFVTRAIFSIPKFLRLQEAKFQILVETAKQQGVTQDVITSIHKNCGVPERLKTDAENVAERQKLQQSRTQQQS